MLVVLVDDLGHFYLFFCCCHQHHNNCSPTQTCFFCSTRPLPPPPSQPPKMSPPPLCAAVLIGCLPTYTQAGLAAPILLSLLRLIQGIAVGGELGTAVVFMHELAPPGRKTRGGSIIFVGVTAGILMGIIVAMIVNAAIPRPDLLHWGWRLPFLLAIVTALAGLLLRYHMPEVIWVCFHHTTTISTTTLRNPSLCACCMLCASAAKCVSTRVAQCAAGLGTAALPLVHCAQWFQGDAAGVWPTQPGTFHLTCGHLSFHAAAPASVAMLCFFGYCHAVLLLSCSLMSLNMTLSNGHTSAAMQPSQYRTTTTTAAALHIEVRGGQQLNASPGCSLALAPFCCL